MPLKLDFYASLLKILNYIFTILSQHIAKTKKWIPYLGTFVRSLCTYILSCVETNVFCFAKAKNKLAVLLPYGFSRFQLNSVLFFELTTWVDYIILFHNSIEYIGNIYFIQQLYPTSMLTNIYGFLDWIFFLSLFIPQFS